MANQAIATRVDSKIAKYHLERGVGKAAPDTRLDTTIAALDGRLERPLPKRAQLQEIAREHSPDLATLLLVERMLDWPCNAAAQRAFNEYSARFATMDWPQRRRRLAGGAGFLIMFAPGWFYRTNPGTGADFARPRRFLEQAGLRTALIETLENGTVEDNAAIIAAAIRSQADARQPALIVSTSKAGPEVMEALSRLERDGAAHGVAAWINIGGVLHGSRLADTAVTWPQKLLVKTLILGGRSMQGIESMTSNRSLQRIQGTHLPPDLVILNYVGVPLSGDVSEPAAHGYARLRKFGPNDGHTLILDEILPGSISIVEPGVDHFYRHQDIGLKSLALTQVVLELLRASASPSNVKEPASHRQDSWLVHCPAPDRSHRGTRGGNAAIASHLAPDHVLRRASQRPPEHMRNNWDGNGIDCPGTD